MTTVSVLETGTIRIRPSHRCQDADRPVALRRLRVLTDRRWTDPLPINTYLIEHPDGPILFDTGESPHATEHGWLPRWQPFFQLAVDISVAPHESIGSRLAERGIAPEDLQAIVVSHLHHDHGDGLGEIGQHARVIVSRQHWDAFRHPVQATIEGAVPQHWPHGFSPELVDLTGPPLGPWPATYPLTADGRVVGVPTPGHVPGHMSVVVFADSATYFLGGDVTYDQALLDAERTDGVNNDPHRATESLRQIKRFAQETPLVLLPAHDPDAARRLAQQEVYRPTFRGGMSRAGRIRPGRGHRPPLPPDRRGGGQSRACAAPAHVRATDPAPPRG